MSIEKVGFVHLFSLRDSSSMIEWVKWVIEMKSITLASMSKFKSEILDRVGLKHTCMGALGEEVSETLDPYLYVMELAYNKAVSIQGKTDSTLIVGLDTIVLTNGKIVEKPSSIEEARKNLEDSRMNESIVITGICVINQETGEVVREYQATKIFFKDIKDEDIDYYMEHEEDILYASGFIIENIASNFIEKIEGSYYNILGAPVEKIYEIFNGMGIYLKDICR